MATSRTGRRALGALAAVATATALTGCGTSGVFTDGGVAATYGDTTVSTTQVQDVVADLRSINPQTQISGQQAAVLLALAPAIGRIAAQNGAAISSSMVEQTFAQNGLRDASPATISMTRANGELGQLLQGRAAGQEAINRLINTADVQLNPRYGSYAKGGAIGPAPTPWIRPDATASAQPAPPQ